MQELWEFAVNNWGLVLAFILVTGWWIGMEWFHAASGVKVVDCESATRLYNSESARFIDTRPGAEHRKGHLPEAFSMPEAEFDQLITKLQRECDSGQPLIVYDPDGALAGRVARKLRKQGFEKVYRLKGGLKAWVGAGYPVEGRKGKA